MRKQKGRFGRRQRQRRIAQQGLIRSWSRLVRRRRAEGLTPEPRELKSLVERALSGQTMERRSSAYSDLLQRTYHLAPVVCRDGHSGLVATLRYRGPRPIVMYREMSLFLIGRFRPLIREELLSGIELRPDSLAVALGSIEAVIPRRRIFTIEKACRRWSIEVVWGSPEESWRQMISSARFFRGKKKKLRRSNVFSFPIRRNRRQASQPLFL